MSEKMYVVFLKAVISLIVLFLWFVVFMLAKAGGGLVAYGIAYGILAVVVLFLAWLWTKEKTK